MNEDEEDSLIEDECCITYELDQDEVLDFNKDKSDRWERAKDFFDEIYEE